MTTWNEVKTYVHQNYKVEDVHEGLMKLLFEVSLGRSQLVFIEHAHNDSGADWIKVVSPIGKLDSVNVVEAAKYVAKTIVGGILVEGDLVCVTNAMPLQNLDANELDEPMRRVTMIADDIEKLLTGTDNW